MTEQLPAPLEDETALRLRSKWGRRNLGRRACAYTEVHPETYRWYGYDLEHVSVNPAFLGDGDRPTRYYDIDPRSDTFVGRLMIEVEPGDPDHADHSQR